MDETEHRLTVQFSALAHPARRAIIRWIGHHDRCQCKQVVDAIPLAQSTVSQHLKVLLDAGLLRAEQRGPSSHFTLDTDALAAMRSAMGDWIETCCPSQCCGGGEKRQKSGD